MNEAKPGPKTTEFWVTILTLIATLGGSASGILPAPYAALAAGISTAAYSISRGLAKKGEVQQ